MVIMNLKNKSSVLEYLSNLADTKNEEDRDPRRWLSHTIEYCKYLLTGGKTIDFSIDMKNCSNDLSELETHIQAVIEKVEGDIRIVNECLSHFQSAESRYSLVGREYCINVLKDAEIRLNNHRSDRHYPQTKDK
jgi:hypothetical protein